MSKSGFSTLNRWLGIKNKDKTNAPNGKLSKSSTNLSISSTNLSDPSQLEYNRIAPLPAITSNAPFEQTFRITVLLPKDQLYVARLGARVPLSKLLELVCDHKSLDAQKYEFRNPVDPSQIYNCDLTIGAVGLSEIRLCHKSDSYDSYNTDEVIKLHRTSVIRDSLSSSEFSSRHSKHTTKTASPYSSSNSLNSMDSTGMNYTRTPITAPPALPKSTPPKVAAPPRKKRAAPRPPSQIVIPEKDALVIDQEVNKTEQTIEALKQQQETMGVTMRRDYFASTPNLSAGDCNGNASPSPSPSSKTEILTNGNSEDSETTQVAQKNARNLHSVSVQNLSIESPNEDVKKLPEPSPRKRLIQIKKKSAPAPPPRGSSINGNEDAVSIASTTLSTPDTPNTADSEKMPAYFQESIIYENENQKAPSPPATRNCATTPTKQPLQSSTPVSITKSTEVVTAESSQMATAPSNLPKPSPRQTTTTLLNASPPPASPTHVVTQRANVSKVLLNRTPTPEPRSLSCEPTDQSMELLSNANCDDDNDSKQADSGIGEPVPSPIPDSLPSEGSAHEFKSTFESSSDDDEMIKTYNFKLGKTTVKTILEERAPQTLDEFKSLQVDSGEVTPATLTHEPTPNTAETTSWNFSIPISPPPNFADNANQQPMEQVSTDAPITPKIVERPVLNFDSLTTTTTTTITREGEGAKVNSADVADHSSVKAQTVFEKCVPRTPLPSPSTPINEIIDELSTILNEKRVDTLIRKHDEQTKIESAKPNTLSNFSITTLTTTQQSSRPVEVYNAQESASQQIAETTTLPSPSLSSADDEEKIYRKRGSLTNGSAALKQKRAVNRADSFHTSRQNSIQADTTNGLNSRSASYLSLTKLDQNGALAQRRSSSELSIGESPSLQSLEVMKTILNSRKNSLANSSDSGGESNKTPSIEVVNIERKTTKVETKITSVEFKPKQVESVAMETQTETVESAKPKELPKVYRYSGPPNINLSTWSERPKVEVAIKNEGDYIFGGKKASTQSAAVTHADVEIRSAVTMPRSQRATMPASAFRDTTPPVVAPKPAAYAATSTITTTTTERMGIPEKEYRVPVTVRTLKDVTVESVEIKTNAALSGDSKQESTIQKRQFNQAANTSTLPRAGNRFSMPAKPITPGQSLLRSTSITQLDAQQQQRTTTVENEATITAPFGQNTLRRTGLKEKILAKEEQAQKQQQQMHTTQKSTQNSTQQNTNNNVSMVKTKVNSSTYTNGTTVSTAASFPQNTRLPFQTSTKILQSAKLELKLNPNFGRENGLKTPESPKAKTPSSAPAAPPPPPMPVLKSVTLRSKSAGSAATTPTNGDPRDALLAAIRNFKRDDLNSV